MKFFRAYLKSFSKTKSKCHAEPVEAWCNSDITCFDRLSMTPTGSASLNLNTGSRACIRVVACRVVIFLAASLFIISDCFSATVEEEIASGFSSFILDLVSTTQTGKHGKICGLGSDEISKTIASQDKNFINLDLEPKKFEQCKAVYVAQGRAKGLSLEIEKFNRSRILTIAVFDDFTGLGGMLQVQIGRRNFELVVNSKTLKDSGIRLNALTADLVVN
jgi:hypothetical protein